MRRFYFDIDDGDRLVLDSQGLVFDCVDQAANQARNCLSAVVLEVPADNVQRTVALRVRDETGITVLKAGLSILLQLVRHQSF